MVCEQIGGGIKQSKRIELGEFTLMVEALILFYIDLLLGETEE